MLVVACLWLTGLHGQNAFNIPHSQFGIGISELPYNTPMATRMGGAIYTRSGHNFINPFNPASYAAIQMESFVFDMGFNIQTSTIKAQDNTAYDADGNIGYMMMGMPITKHWKLAFGLMPFSTVDYETLAMQESTELGSVKNVYNGTGGVNQVFLGSAFNLLQGRPDGKQLQIGINANYMTGDIERALSYAFPGSDSTYALNGRRYKKTSFSNLFLDFGLQYMQPLTEKIGIGVALTYKPYMHTSIRDNALIYTYHTYDESLVDTIFPARNGDSDFKSSLEQPHTFGVGVNLTYNRLWNFAADYTFSTHNGLVYKENEDINIFGHTSLDDESFQRIAAGIEKVGNMDASSYWGRMSWSIGVHRETGAMYMNHNGSASRIDEWGIGAGITLPMRKGQSQLGLSVAYSSFGSKDILQRNTLTFGIAVSSCEKWFSKRKYN